MEGFFDPPIGGLSQVSTFLFFFDPPIGGLSLILQQTAISDPPTRPKASYNPISKEPNTVELLAPRVKQSKTSLQAERLGAG